MYYDQESQFISIQRVYPIRTRNRNSNCLTAINETKVNYLMLLVLNRTSRLHSHCTENEEDSTAAEYQV